MKKLILLLLVMPLLGMAQKTGTHFERGLNLSQGKDKAQQENKLLLVVYVESRDQEENSRVFSNERVARLLNEKFVNITICGNSKNGKFGKQNRDKGYQVDTYPTYLFFSTNGELVHRVAGEKYPYNFLEEIRNSLDPASQYYSMVKKFAAGERSPEFLKKLTVAANHANEAENTSNFLQAYLDIQTNLFTAENLRFLVAYTNSSKEQGFELLMKEGEKADEILGAGAAKKKLSAIIFQEEFAPKLAQKRVNAEALVTAAKSKYPDIDAQNIDLMLVEFLERQANWNKLQLVLPAYVEKYADQIGAETLNYYAWLVQEYMNSPAIIHTALTWSKKSIDATAGKKAMYLGTYAKLLYKAGDVEEALIWQQKSVDDEENTITKNAYAAVLEKMKK